MRANFVVIATLSILALFLISSPTTIRSYSYSQTPASDGKQSVTLDIQQGWITNAGPQKWAMSGGILAVASDTYSSVLSRVTWTNVNYVLSAEVNGLTSTGHFRLNLTGTTADGRPIELRIHTI